MNYYQIFGISQTASQIEIKKAYRLLAKQYHPDKHQGNPQYESKFKQINSIYETLSSPLRRSQYDQLLAFKNMTTDPKKNQADSNNNNFSNNSNRTTNSYNQAQKYHQNPLVDKIVRMLSSFMKLVQSTYITRWLFSMFLLYLVGSFFQFIYDLEIKRQQRKREKYRYENSIETGDFKFNNKDETIRVDSAANYDGVVDSAVTEPKTGDIKF